MRRASRAAVGRQRRRVLSNFWRVLADFTADSRGIAVVPLLMVIEFCDGVCSADEWCSEEDRPMSPLTLWVIPW